MRVAASTDFHEQQDYELWPLQRRMGRAYRYWVSRILKSPHMVTLHSQGESLYDVSSAVHNTAFKHYKLAVYFMTLIELTLHTRNTCRKPSYPRSLVVQLIGTLPTTTSRKVGGTYTLTSMQWLQANRKREACRSTNKLCYHRCKNYPHAPDPLSMHTSLLCLL